MLLIHTIIYSNTYTYNTNAILKCKFSIFNIQYFPVPVALEFKFFKIVLVLIDNQKEVNKEERIKIPRKSVQRNHC